MRRRVPARRLFSEVRWAARQAHRRSLRARRILVESRTTNGTPDIQLLQCEELAVIDNLSGRLYLIVYADPGEAEAYSSHCSSWMSGVPIASGKLLALTSLGSMKRTAS